MHVCVCVGFGERVERSILNHDGCFGNVCDAKVPSDLGRGYCPGDWG